MGYVDLDTIHRAANNTKPPHQWGDQVNDNFKLLAGSAGAQISTNEGTTSTAFVDLATVGPSVSVTTGTKAIVLLSVWGNTGTGGYGFMGFTVSGATTRAVNLTQAAAFTEATQNSVSAVAFVTGLTPGVNVFTAKYSSSSAGTTQQFQDRSLIVIPLP